MAFVWLVLLIVILYTWQPFNDWLRLLGYAPPIEISSLAANDTMTDTARHTFYLNKPLLVDKTKFDAYCKAGSEHTIILGCYRSGERGIFLLDVTDSRLAGVEQVTAAHEMLHGAYERLDGAQRQQVNGMLTDYYNHSLKDKRVLDTLAAYQKSEPNDITDEMHSIFGSEIATLPQNLEMYYRRYFTDRSAVVRYAESYEQEFTGRQQQITDYDAKLAAMKQQIDKNEADLQNIQADLRTRRNRMDQLQASGQFEAYNEAVPGFNALVDTYNAQIADTKQLIARYNEIVAARNNLLLEEQQLMQALNTNLIPAPAQ